MSINPNTIQAVQRVVGNREPIRDQLLNNDGTVRDLTGLSILFRLIRISTAAVIVNGAAATIDEAATGKVSYRPAADEVNTAGRYAWYFLIENGIASGIDERFPFDGAYRQLELIAETAVGASQD